MSATRDPAGEGKQPDAGNDPDRRHRVGPTAAAAGEAGKAMKKKKKKKKESANAQPQSVRPDGVDGAQPRPQPQRPESRQCAESHPLPAPFSMVNAALTNPLPPPLYMPIVRTVESYGGIEPRNLLPAGAHLVFPSSEMLGAVDLHAISLSLQADSISSADALNKLLIVSSNRDVAISLPRCGKMLDALLSIAEHALPPVPNGTIVPLKTLLDSAETQELTNGLAFAECQHCRDQPYANVDGDNLNENVTFDTGVTQGLAAVTILANLSFSTVKNDVNSAFLAGDSRFLQLLARCLVCGEFDPSASTTPNATECYSGVQVMPSVCPLSVFGARITCFPGNPRKRPWPTEDDSQDVDSGGPSQRSLETSCFENTDKSDICLNLIETDPAVHNTRHRPRSRQKLLAPEAVEFREAAMLILSNISQHLRLRSVDDARFILAVLTDHVTLPMGPFSLYSTPTSGQFAVRAAETLSRLGLKGENREILELAATVPEVERAFSAFAELLLWSPIAASYLKRGWRVEVPNVPPPVPPWSQEEHGRLELVLCALGTIMHFGGQALACSPAFHQSGCLSLLRRLSLAPDAFPQDAPQEAVASIRKRALSTLKELKVDASVIGPAGSFWPLQPMDLLEALADGSRCMDSEVRTSLVEILL